MDLPINHFKRALKAGKLQVGLWSHLCSPISAEILGQCGFDWMCWTWSTRPMSCRRS